MLLVAMAGCEGHKVYGRCLSRGREGVWPWVSLLEDSHGQPPGTSGESKEAHPSLPIFWLVP